jgi:dienelactone hydrolase
MHRTTLAAAAACLTLGGVARAEIRTKTIEYRQADTPLQGFLAWDDAVKDRRPGVLVVHEWWGENEHARNQAVRLAKAGYVGFALDMYGKGKVTTHPADAQAFAREATKDPAVARARFDAAMAVLKAQPQVDASRIGVVGYCFGGGVALEMARAGADIDALATFHGALAPHGEPARKGRVKPRILVATGGADPLVPRAQVEAFEREMKAAGANFQVVTYPNAKHSFTNPAAGDAGMAGLAYDARADRESWKAAMRMFREVFGR